MNAVYHGLVLCGTIVSSLYPGLQEHLSAGVRSGLRAGLRAVVAEVYRSGNVPLAALLTKKRGKPRGSGREG